MAIKEINDLNFQLNDNLSDDNKLTQNLDEGSDFIKENIPDTIGVIPLFKLTIFPFQISPLIIANPKSIKLIDDVIMTHKLICAVTQKEGTEEYGKENLYKFGTICKILRMIRLPNQSVRILLQGIIRAEIKEYISEEPYITAKINIKTDIVKPGIELDALKRNIVDSFRKIASYIPQIGEELQIIVMNIEIQVN